MLRRAKERPNWKLPITENDSNLVVPKTPCDGPNRFMLCNAKDPSPWEKSITKRREKSNTDNVAPMHAKFRNANELPRCKPSNFEKDDPNRVGMLRRSNTASDGPRRAVILMLPVFLIELSILSNSKTANGIGGLKRVSPLIASELPRAKDELMCGKSKANSDGVK